MEGTREGLLYTDGHMWVERLEGMKVRIGMTDRAQSDLGDVVYVDLPKEGMEFSKGDEIGALESVKSIEPIRAPVSGRVVGRNGALEETPELVNESPYDEGWIFVAEVLEPSELDSLLDAQAYAGLL